jgi:hypothetical protein
MKLPMVARRTSGEIFNCKFGHRWPLNLHTDGFVRVHIDVTRKGNLKLGYTWAATVDELLDIRLTLP